MLTCPGAVGGDTVFYNNNILHCGVYTHSIKRATLHASMGDTRGGAARARNVLQHGLSWMKDNRFKDTLDDCGQAMLSRLIKMQEGVSANVVYSLEG